MTDPTKRLYFDDPYRMEFEAVVVDKLICEGKPGLILDQSCFYPESGGQPSDSGTLNGVEVLKVFEEGDQIVHQMEKEIIVEKVQGRIDWKTRFDHMQQHAGQHILSQSFMHLFKAETLSFHLGSSVSTIEVNLRTAGENDIRRAEELANRIVFEDRLIKSYFVRMEDIEKIPLRKPPQVAGIIRIVEVDRFDHSACGGTHPRRTGEIGLIKILKWERIRDNVRLEFVCGFRALDDYSFRNSILRQVSLKFSSGENEVGSSVDKLMTDLKAQKKTIKKMQEQLIHYEAEELIRQVRGKIIKKAFVGRAPEEMRFLALSLIKMGDCCVLFGSKLETRAHLVLACSEKLGADMNEIVPIVSALLEGKGGGRSSLVEISGERKENMEAALNRAHEWILKKGI